MQSEITEYQSIDETKLGKILSACSKTLILNLEMLLVPTEGTGSGLIIKEVLDTNSLIITIISRPLKTNLHSDR